MLVLASGPRNTRLANKAPDAELRLVSFIVSGVRLGSCWLLEIRRKVHRQQFQLASHKRTHSLPNAGQLAIRLGCRTERGQLPNHAPILTKTECHLRISQRRES